MFNWRAKVMPLMPFTTIKAYIEKKTRGKTKKPIILSKDAARLVEPEVMNDQPLQYVVVRPTSRHTSTVIFLHGLGDNGYGMRRLLTEMAPTLPHTKWILPHAPEMNVTVNRGMTMPSWFDIYSAGNFDTKKQDVDGMLASAISIYAFIAAELAAGIPVGKIVVGGLSQGCAMALFTGLTTEYKLAGIVCISGYVPDQPNIQELVTSHCTDVPVFWAHGLLDPQVPIRFAESSINFLKYQLSFRDVTYKTYVAGHWPEPEQLRDAAAWMANKLYPEESTSAMA